VGSILNDSDSESYGHFEPLRLNKQEAFQTPEMQMINDAQQMMSDSEGDIMMESEIS